MDEDVAGCITAVDAERGCDLCHTGDMLTLATFPSVAGYGKLTPSDNSIERCSCMMGQLITSPTHAFGNVLRSVTRFPDLRGHNHVQITSPVRELRAALRLLQFKPEDRMFKPVSWVLLGGRPISEHTWARLFKALHNAKVGCPPSLVV